MRRNKKNDIMDINEFVSSFKTHPILFIGSGLSRRYLEYSPDWNELLSDIAKDIWGDDSKFLELSEKHNFDSSLIASDLEIAFKQEVKANKKFSRIKDQFDELLRKKTIISPFKLYLANKFSFLNYKTEMTEEINLFKGLSNNIKSIVTTNYDGMLEDLFSFDKLIGNNILLSRQYGSIYKMHGCYTEPSQIIFTSEDYTNFADHNKLIILQLISLFIHSPVIFLGYGKDDANVNSVLETIFSYIGSNQELREKVKNNFLIVEYKEDSLNTKVTGYDRTLPTGIHLSLHRIETDDYASIYRAISDSPCAIEAGILRLVDNLMERVFLDSKDKKNAKIVNYFFEDIKGTNPSDLVLGIMNNKDVDQVKESIVYKKKKVLANITSADLISNYFENIDRGLKGEEVEGRLDIGENDFVPVFGYEYIGYTYINIKELKNQQKRRIRETNPENWVTSTNKMKRDKYPKLLKIGNQFSISAIKSLNMADHWEKTCILYNSIKNNIQLDDLEEHLKSLSKQDLSKTEGRKLLCVYDYRKYGYTNEDVLSK